MKNLRGCRWERRVSPTTRGNSVQPPIKETLHLFILLWHNHKEIECIVFNTFEKYLQ